MLEDTNSLNGAHLIQMILMSARNSNMIVESLFLSSGKTQIPGFKVYSVTFNDSLPFLREIFLNYHNDQQNMARQI